MTTTPFGEAMQRLRQARGVTQKQMAAAIGVSGAYLSALERGQRGAPSFDLIQKISGYLHVIWDEQDQLFEVASLSHPKVTLDTSGLPAGHMAFANRLAQAIRTLPPDLIAEMDELLEKARNPAKQP
ncbi:transcriptional regulator [Rhizobium rhizosphaerae]|uniref:Transcriptional regulator n=1 Tax=Xaviernesmea rhizosphaerae TaxID=1672749 RepID=A0A1Q9AGD2_9HYPH|nr:helix-turn-helix domain-containing protein [Xaviernesmea rhizosphaerae]OLP54025.1 transcriptional regulator [Xaviernesmea rhizosphaerae]